LRVEKFDHVQQKFFEIVGQYRVFPELFNKVNKLEDIQLFFVAQHQIHDTFDGNFFFCFVLGNLPVFDVKLDLKNMVYAGNKNVNLFLSYILGIDDFVDFFGRRYNLEKGFAVFGDFVAFAQGLL
jgi:hypothetical protein